MVIIEKPPQKPTGPYIVPLTHMSNCVKSSLSQPQGENTFSAMPAYSSTHVKLIIRRHIKTVWLRLNPFSHSLPPSTLSIPRQLCATYPHISGRGTHHGRCWGGHDGVGEGREGMLVGVLVGVLVLMLVLMLVLVELGAQVGRRAQRGAAVGAL